MSPVERNRNHLLIATLCLLALVVLACSSQLASAGQSSENSTAPTVTSTTTANPDECEKCGPTRLIGCRAGRCYYKCIRRCLGKDNKFYYEALKFNFAGL